jgi:EAL domain-containing protein (putative c-di-GMP-specific phosphodiesterase class I)
VETKEQVEFLNTLGCDYLQGYFFSKPIPANQLLEFSNNLRH